MGVRWWRKERQRQEDSKYVPTTRPTPATGPPPGYGYPDAWWLVGAATAAAPFLQAVATHFGNRFATGLDNSTRRALRRFLRRELRRQNAQSSDQARKIKLRTGDGWEIKISTDIPAEALAQLLALQDATHPELDPHPTPCLDWTASSWQVKGVRNGALVEHTWNAESGRWSDY
jgi:hypothetical protein